MKPEEFVSLIDELSAKATECRELLSDMRSMDKTLRRTIKEAQETVDKLVAEKVDAKVAEQLDKSLEQVKIGFKRIEEKVSKEIQELADTLLQGPRNRRGKEPGLADLARRKHDPN